MSKPQYLLNPKSGAVMPCTELLLKLGNGLVACNKEGQPLNTYSLEDDDDVMQSNFLLNPVTGAILPWSLLLARKEGLIPCNNRDHANSILLNLGKDELVVASATVTSINATKDKDVKLDTDQETVGLDSPEAQAEPESEIYASELDADQEEVKKDDGIDLSEIVEMTIPEHIDAMTNKKDIVKYVKENFDESLDARVNITMLKEQAAMLYNEKNQDNDKLEEVSMA